jgi:hypothetical protein
MKRYYIKKSVRRVYAKEEGNKGQDRRSGPATSATQDVKRKTCVFSYALHLAVFPERSAY